MPSAPELASASRAARGRLARGVPILMYHQVAPDSPAAFRKYTVTPSAFAAQLRWLALAGYVAVGMDALLEKRRSGELPRRPVVITFDDGFQASAEHAVPTLTSLGFTATFYLVAGLMGQPSRWLLAERGVEFPLMSWTTARELHAAGFTCGAHTVTHPRLAQLPAAECFEELRRSREMIEERVGSAVSHLAYPFGSYDDRVRAMAAEAGYSTASSVRIGLSAPDDDLFALHRVPVTGYDRLTDFICRVRTARTASELLRGKARGAWRQVRRLTWRPA